MRKGRAICYLALALWAATTLIEAVASPSQSGPPGTTHASVQPQTRYERVSAGLKTLREALTEKRTELAKLHHKWMVSKGRTPTKEELKEFEKKRAKGEVKTEDNPYVNKTPLSSPGHWRAAYYQKLEEIKKEEEREKLLELELDGLKP